MPRIFTGVWIDPPMRREVMEFISAANRNNSGFRWTPLENLHFTLKFIGEVASPDVHALAKACASVAKSGTPFLMQLGKVGGFPSVQDPRIVWLGLTRGGPELSHLARVVAQAVDAVLQTQPEREFVPHLTIARAAQRKPAPLCLPQETPFLCTTEVRSFSLIESKLTRSGSIYRTIEEYVISHDK